MPDIFKDQNFPDNNIGFLCDGGCGTKVDPSKHNNKCTIIGCLGYYKIPSYS